MKKLIIVISVLIVGFVSCTDLDVKVYHDIVSDKFFKTEKQVLSAAGPAYSSLRGCANVNGIWGLNSLTTDEMLIPTRGVDWYNGGIYQRMHKHEWLTTDFTINNAWGTIYNGVTNCNRAIYTYEQVDEQSDALISVLNELKALRAFYYFMAMDLYGNVPLVDRYDVPAGFAPENSTREEIFDFVEQELTNGTPLLNNIKDMTTYGRFHRWAAFTLQAKLYLNAEVYTGQAMWDECIDACDSVINSGLYTLSEDYFENFIVLNEGSTENIFVVPFDDLDAIDWGNTDMYFQHHLWTLHFVSAATFDMEQGAWDGMCAIPSFYHSYDENDIRRNAWLTGLQFSSTGDTLYGNHGMRGQPLVFSVDFSSIEGATEMDGARIVKYDYHNARNSQLANDWVIFRYADVLLMKAEATMRKNGGTATQEAVDLVNEVRERGFPDDPGKLYTTTTLTLDELLAERGREFAGEGLRRNDQVRFGTYNNPSDFRPAAVASTYSIFPIPEDQRNANPNLEQNPGY